VNQDDLESVRRQFEIDQNRRDEEAEWLNTLLAEVEEQLEQLADGLESRKHYYGERTEIKRRSGEAPDPNQQEFERYYWNVLDRKFKLERRLYDLIREERDDLDHIAKLEGRERARELAMRRLHEQPPEGVGRTDRTHVAGTVRKNRQHKRRSTKRQTGERNN